MQTNQFSQNALDAKNKMNLLTNPTDDIANMVTNLYNSTCTSTPGAQTQNTAANPFGMTSNTMNSGGSMFGGGAATTNNSLFGSSTATSSNPFARNAAGFGATQPQPQTANLFGGSTTNTNLFGGGNTASATSGGSLFGGSTFSNANNTSAFGGGASQSNSLFGGAATSGPFSQQNTNTPFAMASTTNQPSSGLFGAQSNPVFGGGATFGNQVKPSPFGQANSGTFGQTTNTGNIFGQNTSAAQPFGAPQQTNLFASAAAQNQTTSLFGGMQQQQTMQSDNPFAAATANWAKPVQPQQQPQASPFQNNAFGGNANAFGQNANMVQPLFGGVSQANPMNPVQAAQAPAPQSLQQQQQSIFGTSTFGAQQPAVAPVQTPFGGGNIFQTAQEQSQPTQPLFGGQQQQQQHQHVQQNPFGAPAPQPIQQSKSLYTPMDSLSQEEIEAFNNNKFDINKIPTKPPPMELCI